MTDTATGSLSDCEVETLVARAGRQPVLAVLSGPSGVGKDSVLAELTRIGHDFRRVITVTTRPKRADEVNGVDYHFVDRDRYQTILDDGELVEHAEVYGFWYGVPWKPIEQWLGQGRDVILRIDVQGALTIKRKLKGAVLIFLAAPTIEAQVERLRQRKSEPPAVLARRVATAVDELKQIRHFDYLVVSQDNAVDRAAQEIAGILIAERHRIERSPIERRE